MITDIEEINSIEDVIEYFENKGTPLTEDEKAIFYSDIFLKKNSDKKLVKICEAEKCRDGVWCEGKDYCEIHQSEQEKLQSLVQQKFPSSSNLQEVIRFETWWNKNLGTVISGDCPYALSLVVYEPKQRIISSEIIKKLEINNDYDKYSLDSTKSKAASLRTELNGENPILVIHPYVNNYVSFDSLITSSYVFKECLSISETSPYPNISMIFPLNPLIRTIHHYPNNPSDCLKPLDVVKVKCTDRLPIFGIPLTGGEYFYHVGVYLGKIDGEFKVCHFSKEEKGTRIQSWEKFLEGATGELIRYHPLIPFKHYSKIACQIAWTEKESFRENDYNLCNRNCEHLANMLVYGINYSEQIEEKKVAIWAVRCGTAPYSFIAMPPNQTFNNDKGSVINLTNELAETEDKLGYTSAYHWRTEQIQTQYLQEVPTKQECRIM